MKTTSLLAQAYKKQENIAPPLPDPPKPTFKSELKRNVWFFIRWFLIGGLTSGIPLAVFVVLYIRKQQGLTPYTVVVNSRYGNARMSSLQWTKTGIVLAGHTNSPGPASDQLNSPSSLALDMDEALYITDSANHRVQKYSRGASNGMTVAGRPTGVAGSFAADLNTPSCAIVDPDNKIYITDSGNHRALVWSHGIPFGTLFAGTGVAGNGSNEFNLAKGLTYDPTSATIYIADFYNDRIVSYTMNSRLGTVVAGGNGCGFNPNQLSRPIAVHYDRSSNSLLISNYGSHSIVRWALGASNWTLVAGNPGRAGSSSNLLDSPAGFSIDSMGNLYVADAGNHRIQFFLPDQSHGTTIAGITGRPGSDLNLLHNPMWVSIDKELNLYVADTKNHRVLRFSRY